MASSTKQLESFTSTTRSRTKLTPAQRTASRKAAARKAAAARKLQRHEVLINGKRQVVTGSQLAGLRAAASRTPQQRKAAAAKAQATLAAKKG